MAKFSRCWHCTSLAAVLALLPVLVLYSRQEEAREAVAPLGRRTQALPPGAAQAAVAAIAREAAERALADSEALAARGPPATLEATLPASATGPFPFPRRWKRLRNLTAEPEAAAGALAPAGAGGPQLGAVPMIDNLLGQGALGGDHPPGRGKGRGQGQLAGGHGQAGGPSSSGLRSALGERSSFLPFLLKDLERWRSSGGITQELVQEAFDRVRECTGWAPQPYWIRFQILGGKLWVEHWTPKEGHYPAEYGRGWVSAKGRLPYAILAIMDVLHHFPGTIPDLDAVVAVQDTPCIPAGNGSTVPPPAFSFTGSQWAADIPFPDMTYYGHEVSILDDDQGRWIYGWDAQLQHYVDKWSQPLYDRVPRMVWRGRTSDWRDWVRRDFSDCPVWFWGQNDTRSAALFNTPASGDGPINLDSMCRYMFQVYLESGAYSSSLRQRLACGSVLLAPTIEFHEFWTRGLEPGRHYLPAGGTPNMTVCNATVNMVRAMTAFLYGTGEGHSDLAAASAPGGSSHDEASSGASGGPQQAAAEAKPDGDSKQEAGAAAAAQPRSAGPPQQAQQAEQRQDTPAPVQRRMLEEGQGQQTPSSIVEQLGGEQAGLAAKQQQQQQQQQQQRRYPWGSSLTPQEIADEGRKFLRDHVRMADVRLYLRDALAEYGALMAYQPRPSEYARCYTGKMLLQEFGIPFKEDAADVAAQYPWLDSWDPGCRKKWWRPWG